MDDKSTVIVHNYYRLIFKLDFYIKHYNCTSNNPTLTLCSMYFPHSNTGFLISESRKDHREGFLPRSS